MPYIKQDERSKYLPHIDGLVRDLSSLDDNALPGHLNFVIFSIVTGLLKEMGWRYFRINALIGALECCKMEIYRRLAAWYEDGAISKNGDIAGVPTEC